MWTYRARRRVTADLETRPLAHLAVPPPPALPAHARTRRDRGPATSHLDPTCLERSLVLQRWMAGHGEPRAVIVGVAGPRNFKAHAWLGGGTPPPAAGFAELTRIAT
jgi:hypothetical protein